MAPRLRCRSGSYAAVGPRCGCWRSRCLRVCRGSRSGARDALVVRAALQSPGSACLFSLRAWRIRVARRPGMEWTRIRRLDLRSSLSPRPAVSATLCPCSASSCRPRASTCPASAPSPSWSCRRRHADSVQTSPRSIRRACRRAPLLLSAVARPRRSPPVAARAARFGRIRSVGEGHIVVRNVLLALGAGLQLPVAGGACRLAISVAPLVDKHHGIVVLGLNE